MEPALNIAIAQSPTRQRFWRVVRLGGVALSTWIGIIALTRLCFAWSDVVPVSDHIHLRIVKSPETVANLRVVTKGVTAIPGIPYSLSDLVASSHGVINIDFSPDGSTTLIIDHALSDADQESFRAFGAQVMIDGRETVVTNASTTPTPSHNIATGIFDTLRQGSAARISTQGIGAAVDIAEHTITLRGLTALTPPSIERTPGENTLVFASFSSKDLEGLGNQTFTENTPGLSNFFRLATTNGLSAIIDRTEETLSYTIAAPITDETRALVNESSLRSLASELTEIPTIDGITNYLDDGSRTTALRSREEATVVLRDESPYRFLNATSSKATVTITETPSVLTVSNGGAVPQTSKTPSCLAGTRAFITPSALTSLFPEQTRYEERTLSSLLWNAEVIASATSNTRICMPE